MSAVEIPLSSKKYPGLVALVDSHFWETELHRYHYYPEWNRRNFYVRRSVRNDGKRARFYLHQDVMRLAGIPVPAGRLIDHRDQNGLNCRLENLRLVTYSQNGTNRRPHKNSSSVYLGVSWNKRQRKWIAQTSVDGRILYVGQFDSEIEAAIARDFVAWVHHGPYARLNFPDYWQMQRGVA